MSTDSTYRLSSSRKALLFKVLLLVFTVLYVSNDLAHLIPGKLESEQLLSCESGEKENSLEKKDKEEKEETLSLFAWAIQLADDHSQHQFSLQLIAQVNYPDIQTPPPECA